MSIENNPVIQTNRHMFRAAWHDYRGGVYFVTVCTKDKVQYFGHILNGEMQYSSLGIKLDECIKRAQKPGQVDIPVYTIMPNHFHCIIVLEGLSNAEHTNSGTLKPRNHPKEEYIFVSHHTSLLAGVVGRIKSGLTRYANTHGLNFSWQSRFHEHMIRKKELNNIVNYIQTNPQRWSSDCFYSE